MEWELLADVPQEEVRELLSIARRRRFDRGVVVFHRGDPGDSLHLVVSGRFGVQTMTPLGETATVRILGAGDAFGELALVGRPAPRSATILALEPAETFSVFADDFHRLRARHPGVNDVLVGLLAREVRSLSDRLVEALYVPAEKRIRRRLVELAQTYGGGSHVELPLTQAELGEFAGVARATVNRVLREEARLGAVELRRGRTIVVDPAAIADRGR